MAPIKFFFDGTVTKRSNQSSSKEEFNLQIFSSTAPYYEKRIICTDHWRTDYEPSADVWRIGPIFRESFENFRHQKRWHVCATDKFRLPGGVDNVVELGGIQIRGVKFLTRKSDRYFFEGHNFRSGLDTEKFASKKTRFDFWTVILQNLRLLNDS